jgi:ferredoxin-NADP reductase
MTSMRLDWNAARVVARRDETPRVRSIVFERPMWEGHLAGQHVDIRLTSEDGYQAQRSYSIASAPEDEELVLTVERLEEGEVSPYLVDELEPGDELEMRGPIGRYFVWEPGMNGPLLMIAGGSGVVPFRAMLRHRAAQGGGAPARLLYSSRTIEDLIYREELDRIAEADGAEVLVALTRDQPEGWDGFDRRVDAEILSEVAWAPAEKAKIFVCGPTGFVETVANFLVDLGHDPASIRTERFGPTG